MAEDIAVYAAAFFEYLVIYTGIFGARPEVRRKEARRLIVFDIVINAACLMCVLWLHATTVLYLMVLIASAVNTHELFDLTWTETVSSVPVPYAVFVLIATELECVSAYYSGRQISGASAVCVCIMGMAFWIYLLLNRRRTAGEYGKLPWIGNIIAPALVMTAAAFYSALANAVMYEAQTTAALRENVNEHTDAGLYEADALIIILLMGIAALVFTFAVIYHFNVKYGYERENERTMEYTNMQRQHFQALLEKEQLTKQFRHDMTAQLVQLKALCDEGEYDRLSVFVEEMLGDISSISSYNYDVGNEAANVILNYYLIPAKEECRIEVKGYAPQSEFVSDRDMCIIVSNLVSNALEAAFTLPVDERFVSFSIKCGQIFTYINVKNSYAGQNIKGRVSGSAGVEEKRQGVTTKSDAANHGFGLKNIRNVAMRYHGELVCTARNGIYEAEVRLRNKSGETIK